MDIKIDDYDRELYKESLDHWGVSQVFLMFEELGELQTALAKLHRYEPYGKSSIFAVAEEMADVLIMIEQMIVLIEDTVSPNFIRKIEFFRKQKLERLQKRLEDYKEMNKEGV